MAKTTDHDKIIEISTKLTDLITQVRELKDGVLQRMAELEVRVRTLEDNQNISKGDAKGISNVWKVVVTILTLAIAVLSYYAIIIK